MTNYEYNKKMELGICLVKAIKDGEIAQDSLCSEDSEAFHLYWNTKQFLDIKNLVPRILHAAHTLVC